MFIQCNLGGVGRQKESLGSVQAWGHTSLVWGHEIILPSGMDGSCPGFTQQAPSVQSDGTTAVGKQSRGGGEGMQNILGCKLGVALPQG